MTAYHHSNLQNDWWDVFSSLSWIARENLLIFTVMKTNDQTWQFSSRVNSQLSTCKPVDFPQPIFNYKRFLLIPSILQGYFPFISQLLLREYQWHFNTRLSKLWRKINWQEESQCIQSTNRSGFGIYHLLYYQHHYFLNEQCLIGIWKLWKFSLPIRFRETDLAIFQLFYN